MKAQRLIIRLQEVDTLKSKNIASRMQVNLRNLAMHLRTLAKKLKIIEISKVATIEEEVKHGMRE